MKQLIRIFIPFIFITCSTTGSFVVCKDLTGNWDTERPLENPDKGWYHHMLDNGVHRYLIQDEEEFLNFPGMDHLYLRLAWSFLEPEEGEFDWSQIDDIVEKYVPLGYGISFRISCKETGVVPDSIPYEVDGIGYATPYWVKAAGAKGVDRPEYGPAIWTPDWDDPVYLEKLENFYKAFAARFDGKPWVRYIDIGSIGEWGEGHTFRSTRIPPTVEEVKAHMDLYLKYFKRTPIIATDALIRVGDAEDGSNMLLEFALDNGMGLRDDSPMVIGWLRSMSDTWSVDKPHYFEKANKKQICIFELEHYNKVKDNGLWPEKDGAGFLPEFKATSADIFRNAMKLIRPTYIGFHGYIGEWLGDNPELTKELLNLCGYWYFPKRIRIAAKQGTKLDFEIEWLNKGVAPAFSQYALRGLLIPADGRSEPVTFTIQDSGNPDWMPGQVNTEMYSINLPGDVPPGDYKLAIQLHDPKSGRPVEIGLETSLKKGDYFVIANIAL